MDTNERVLGMRALRVEGRSLAEIGMVYGLTRQRVAQLMGPVGRRGPKPRQRRHRPTAIELFWSNVDRSGGPDACWPWLRFRLANGYGRVAGPNHSMVYAHRMALELSLGRPIATGKMSCHTCDNPPCCNPTHLYEGTAVDNVRDRDARFYGRTVVR